MIDFTCANKVNVRRKSASQQSPKILDVGSEYEETKEAPGGGSVQHVGFGFLGHSDILDLRTGSDGAAGPRHVESWPTQELQKLPSSDRRRTPLPQ